MFTWIYQIICKILNITSKSEAEIMLELQSRPGLGAPIRKVKGYSLSYWDCRRPMRVVTTSYDKNLSGKDILVCSRPECLYVYERFVPFIP